MKLGLMLPVKPDMQWKLASQLGVKYAVTKAAPELSGLPDPSDFNALKTVRDRFAYSGFELYALEGDEFDMTRIKLGLPGRDEDLEKYRDRAEQNIDYLKRDREMLRNELKRVIRRGDEAEILADMTIRTEADMEKAAKTLFERYGCAALVKGGHSINDANDVLFSAESVEAVWFKGRRIDNPNTHGTGCTLSSAIASNLAKGCSLTESVERAKAYLSGALEAMLDLGKGSGPLMHNYALPEELIREV